MCGITASIALPQGKVNGYVNGHTNGTNGHTNGDKNTETLATQLRASIEAINHRGPDESGIWISADESVALGHCRLTINDLSPSGSQPLTSDDGQIHAVVNGEIYDQDRLRRVCESEHGYKFRGESDSELVLSLYKIFGAPGLFEHLRGEFAFVLYDSRKGSKRVIAGRDRFGIKPLVWTVVGNRLLMAAESKAFLPLGWKPEWDVGAIAEGGWCVDDRTIFKGVKKLLPGHWLEVAEGQEGIKTHRYWDAEYKDKTEVETRTIDEMVLGVRERLVEAIRLRLRADVPVGIYLSGGIDSSAVAGIVTQLAKEEKVKIGNQAATTKVSCFCVRFPAESGYDESSIAERTAEWLGVDVIKKDIDEASLARDFGDTAYHCEHHHFDFNCVAKFALSTLPREHGVKVVLTGEGSDEHFAGYWYFMPEFLREPDLSQPDSKLATNHVLRERMQRDGNSEKKTVFRGIGATEHAQQPDSALLADANGSSMPETLIAWQPTMSLFAPWVGERYQDLDFRDTIMASHSPEVCAKMRSRWHQLHTAMYMWNKSSLTNLLLSCLGDRTEMAHSIEARTPFLDHHLAEYVNGLPPSVKIAYTPPDQESEQQGDQGPLWKNAGSALRSLTEKWILREAARPYITDELYQRKKHPFLAPSRWPRDGPLHRMFSELLTREAVEGLGFIDYAVVEKALESAFGEKADSRSFRTLAYVGAWVTLAKRFGVKKASKEDWAVSTAPANTQIGTTDAGNLSISREEWDGVNSKLKDVEETILSLRTCVERLAQ